MPRGYLDEMVPANSGILGQYISPVGPFGEPMYAMVDNDTTVTTPTPTRTRSSKPKKKKSNKSKNDSIIRNHDSVWDYKIQDGKLLTRRKSSDGKWYDITNNDEARSRIESFTNSNIGRPNIVTDKQSNVRQDTTQPHGSLTAQAEPKQNVVDKSSNYIGSQFIPQPISQPNSYIQDFTNSNIGRPNIVTDKQSNVRQDTTQPHGSLTAQAEPKQNVVDKSSNYIGSQFIPQPISQPNSYIQDFTNVGTASREILSNEDLSKNNWHWGGVDDINFEGVSNDLYADAVNKAQTQGRVLLDSKGRPVTTSQVNRYRYLRDDYLPADRTSVADRVLIQPQSDQIPRFIRQAQDRRRNREFDRQRNAALATMFGLPLAGIGAAEATMVGPLALAGGYLGGDIGGKLTNAAMQKMYGRSWDDISNDPNVNFYAQLLNPGRWIGGAAGGYGGAKLWNRMTPIGYYPSGEPEFIGDKIGNIIPKTSNRYNSVSASMLLDPKYQEPVLHSMAPGYTTEIPSNNIRITPIESGEPLWYDTRFQNTQRTLAKASNKRSIKHTKGKKKSMSKKDKEKIVKEAYDKAYK